MKMKVQHTKTNQMQQKQWLNKFIAVNTYIRKILAQ